MILKKKPQLLRAAPAMGSGGKYAIEVGIGSIHIFGIGAESGDALCDLVKNTLGCTEMIAKAGEGTICVATRQEAEKLVRGIIQAALELACLRHELSLPGCPPMVAEECTSIVEDTFKAMHGVDTCDPTPCAEVAELYRVLGVQP